MFLYLFATEAKKLWKTTIRIRRCTHILQTNTMRLRRWRTVRPFIRTGYCGYARALIFQMIAAVEELLTYKPDCIEFKELLSSLHDLLEEFPPPKNPPLPAGFPMLSP